MRCEKCEQEIETRACEGCGQEIRALGPFCYLCGHELGTQRSPGSRTRGSIDDADSPDSLDFTTRILCSDGACIGVIDENGKCKVCGKPYTPEAL